MFEEPLLGFLGLTSSLSSSPVFSRLSRLRLAGRSGYGPTPMPVFSTPAPGINNHVFGSVCSQATSRTTRTTTPSLSRDWQKTSPYRKSVTTSSKLASLRFGSSVVSTAAILGLNARAGHEKRGPFSCFLSWLVCPVDDVLWTHQQRKDKDQPFFEVLLLPVESRASL